MPSPLNRRPENPLVFGANAGPAPWLNLRPVRDVSAYLLYVLVVDVFDMVDAKGTTASARSESASRPAASGSASAGSGSPWGSAARPPSGSTHWWSSHIVTVLQICPIVNILLDLLLFR